MHDYFRLHQVTARAIKKVHRSLRVGGPATARDGNRWERLSGGVPRRREAGTAPCGLGPATHRLRLEWSRHRLDLELTLPPHGVALVTAAVPRQ